MNEKEKLEVLVKIGRKLNEAKVTWAVGASLLLYLNGIVKTFNDIDLMIAEEDVYQVKAILLEMGILEKSNPNRQYKTKHFLEFVIEGVDVDVMAGFVIVNDGKDYYFPLNKDKIVAYKEIEGIDIPLQSLEDWRVYYELMGRVEKVKWLNDRKDSCYTERK